MWFREHITSHILEEIINCVPEDVGDVDIEVDGIVKAGDGVPVCGEVLATVSIKPEGEYN